MQKLQKAVLYKDHMQGYVQELYAKIMYNSKQVA